MSIKSLEINYMETGRGSKKGLDKHASMILRNILVHYHYNKQRLNGFRPNKRNINIR